jgi:hypothetical protein
LSGWVTSSKDREAGTVKVPQMTCIIPERTALNGKTAFIPSEIKNLD